MSAAPHFWATPLKYCRWASRERPALFWSVVIGAVGPAMLPIVPPIRRYFGDIDPAPIPVTYPAVYDFMDMLTEELVPNSPRKHLTGYDD